MSDHERDRIGEIQDRLRRVETRLTKYMQERGFETQVQKVILDIDTVHIPSLDVRLRDILTIIPTGYAGTKLRILHKDRHIMNVFMSEPD